MAHYFNQLGFCLLSVDCLACSWITENLRLVKLEIWKLKQSMNLTLIFSFSIFFSLFLSSAKMTTVADPGPIDKSVLHDQDSHVSSAVWDGQVKLHLYYVFVPHFFFL